VKNPGRVKLSLARESLLDVIALSGGATHTAADSMVTVHRRNFTASVPLTSVQTNATDNILVVPQDRIQVDFAPRTYLVFGATGRVAQIPFDSARMSLAEALAQSGGLDDNRADPASVFLFRMEQPAQVRAIGLASADGPTPVIYRADLRDPTNFFLMERLAMQDKDLLYVANARTVQLYKFLQLIYTFVSPVVTGKQLSQ
jgi:polysaccharide export outer membrane protein